MNGERDHAVQSTVRIAARCDVVDSGFRPRDGRDNRRGRARTDETGFCRRRGNADRYPEPCATTAAKATIAIPVIGPIADRSAIAANGGRGLRPSPFSGAGVRGGSLREPAFARTGIRIFVIFPMVHQKGDTMLTIVSYSGPKEAMMLT